MYKLFEALGFTCTEKAECESWTYKFTQDKAPAKSLISRVKDNEELTEDEASIYERSRTD